MCVSELTIIGSDNGLSPGRRQAIVWTNAGILLIESLGTRFSEILIGILIFLFKKCVWKWRLRKGGHFGLGWLGEHLEYYVYLKLREKLRKNIWETVGIVSG